MRYKLFAVLLPCALALSACTTVTPAYKDNGTRSGPCVEGGLAQLLNDARQDPANSKLLQANPFSSSSTPADSAVVASASTIPNRDARNIPLRVDLKQGTQSWKDEVLMIQEGQCWAVDDVRYLGNNSHAPAGTLRQSLEKR